VNLAPPERRGEALSLYAMTHPISQLLAPPIGVAVAQALGYSWLFAGCIVIHVLGLALMWPLRSLRTAVRPRDRLQVINRAVLLPAVWMMALMVPYGASIGLLPVHALRRGLGNPGVVFTAMAVGALLVLLTIGRTSDRVGRRAVIIPGLALSAAGMWLTAVLHGWALVVAGFSTGLGLGLAQPALFAFGVDLVPEEQRGSALATLGFFLEIGIGVSAIGGGILARGLGTSSMFGLAGLVPAVGAVMAALTPRAHGAERWPSGRRTGF
jgi:MFS family permease